MFSCWRCHQSHGAGRRQQKEQKKTPNLSPFRAKAVSSADSCNWGKFLFMQTDFFFLFGFSCNWTLQTTGCSSPAERQTCAWDYAAKSKGISWPFRLAVTGALSWRLEITLMLFHLSPPSLPLLISMGAEYGTNICSPLQSITHIKDKEKWKLSPSSVIGAIYKLACIRKGGSSLQGEL